MLRLLKVETLRVLKVGIVIFWIMKHIQRSSHQHPKAKSQQPTANTNTQRYSGIDIRHNQQLVIINQQFFNKQSIALPSFPPSRI
jgi:hypothetical protein